MSHQITLRICDRHFIVQSEDDEVTALARASFGAMLAEGPLQSAVPVAGRYRIGTAPSGSGFRFVADQNEPVALEDADSLLFHLDKDLTLALQLERNDLYFLHAAVAAVGNRAVVVSAPSGTGKSTLAFALLDDGFDYLSDELAPIDVQNRTVYPFPHALCLKSPPPPPYRLPAAVLTTGARHHVPVNLLNVTVHTEPLAIAAFIFLRPRSSLAMGYRLITTGAAVAHLISNALNSLAHPGAGLDVAHTLARSTPCYELDSADLSAACRAVREILDAVAPSVAN